MTVNNKKCRIFIHTGPWIDGINPDLIKIRPKDNLFPIEIKSALAVENNSDIMTDYFESDCIRLLPGHSLYQMAKEVSAN